MAFQGDIYNFKIATMGSWPDEVSREFLTGKSNYSGKYNFGMHYILRALSNVTLTLLPFDEVTAKIRDLFRAHNKTAEVKPEYCVKLRFCDTIIQNYELAVVRGIHFSPPFEADEVVILSVVNPTNEMDGGDGKRFSLGGIEASIWIVTLVCLVSLSVLSARLFQRYVRAPLCANGNRLLMTLEYIWFYTSDLLLNGGDIFPRRLSVKLLLSGWLLGTTVLMKAYSGNLKSEMMVSKTLRIDTLEDLKKSPGTRPAVYKESYFAGYIENSRRYSPMMDQLAKETFYFPDEKLNNITSLMGSFPNGTAHYVIMALRYFETAQEYYVTLHHDMKLRPFLASDAAIELNEATVQTLRELWTIFAIWLYGMSVASLFLFGELLLHAIGRRLKSEESTRRPFAF